MYARSGLVVGLVLAVTAVGVPAHGVSGGRRPDLTCDGVWHTMRTPNPANDNGDYDSLASVTAVSSSDVWAVGVGDDFDAPMPGFQPLVEHWNGSKWSTLPTPKLTRFSWNVLSGVSASGPADVWAAGYQNTSPYYSLIEHWDGTRWSVPDAGTGSTYLTSVVALAPDDVWAGGSTNYVGSGLLIHWDGAAWIRTVLPGAIVIRGLAPIGPNDIWAVGQQSTSQFLDLTVAVHWDGSSWTKVPTPSPLRIHPEDENWLTSVVAVSTDDVWATGVARDHDWGISDQPFVVHWDGTKWSMVPSPNIGGGNFDNDLWGAAAFGSNDVWAVGSIGNEPDWSTFTEHWDGASWTEEADRGPGRMLGLATDPTTRALWSVGDHSVSHPYVGTGTFAAHLC
jgi:hypothetical protein